MIEFDDRELNALAVELPELAAATRRATLGVFREAAHELKEKWRAGAKESSGTHGRLYPFAITWDQKASTDLVFEVGPETGRPQGGMGPGFEFGSTNQPAHLDGQKAADDVIPRLERRILLAAEDVFGDA